VTERITLTSLDQASLPTPLPDGLEAAAREACDILTHPREEVTPSQQERFAALLKDFPAIARCRVNLAVEEDITESNADIMHPQVTLLHVAARLDQGFAFHPLKDAGADLAATILSLDPQDKVFDRGWMHGNLPVDVARDNGSWRVLLSLMRHGQFTEHDEQTLEWDDIVETMIHDKAAKEALEMLTLINDHTSGFVSLDYVTKVAIGRNDFESANTLFADPRFKLDAEISATAMREAVAQDVCNRGEQTDKQSLRKAYPNSPSWLEFILKNGANPDSVETSLRPMGGGARSVTNPLTYYSLHAVDLTAIKGLLAYGANLMLPEPLHPSDSVMGYVVSFKNDKTVDAIRLLQAHFEQASDAWEAYASAPDPMALTKDQIYLFCTIGKANEIFANPCWKEPKAANHALDLIDDLIPVQQENLAFARAKLAPFSSAVKSASHGGTVSSASRDRSDT